MTSRKITAIQRSRRTADGWSEFAHPDHPGRRHRVKEPLRMPRVRLIWRDKPSKWTHKLDGFDEGYIWRAWFWRLTLKVVIPWERDERGS